MDIYLPPLALVTCWIWQQSLQRERPGILARLLKMHMFNVSVVHRDMLAVLLALGSLAAALLPASEPTGEAEPRDNLGFCGGVIELLVRFVV